MIRLKTWSKNILCTVHSSWKLLLPFSSDCKRSDLPLGKNHTNFFLLIKTHVMKEALRETQTLRAGCSKAEPKIFALPQTHFVGAQYGQNLIS